MTAQSTDVATDELSDATSDVVPSELDVDRHRWDRIITTTVGGALVLAGLRRRSLGGTVLATAGGWLCYRGIRGTDTLSRVLETSVEAESEAAPERRVVDTDKPGVARSITVGKPADDLVEYWRDPDHLSQIVTFADVHSIDDDRLRWTVEGPLGWGLSWDTRIVEERPGELLRWESLENKAVSFEGTVRFRPAPGDRGTEVTLELRVDSPGGPVGDAALSYLDIAPRTLVGEALRRFKSLAETGEIPTLERNPSARGRGDLV